MSDEDHEPLFRSAEGYVRVWSWPRRGAEIHAAQPRIWYQQEMTSLRSRARRLIGVVGTATAATLVSSLPTLLRTSRAPLGWSALCGLTAGATGSVAFAIVCSMTPRARLVARTSPLILVYVAAFLLYNTWISTDSTVDVISFYVARHFAWCLLFGMLSTFVWCALDQNILHHAFHAFERLFTVFIVVLWWCFRCKEFETVAGTSLVVAFLLLHVIVSRFERRSDSEPDVGNPSEWIALRAFVLAWVSVASLVDVFLVPSQYVLSPRGEGCYGACVLADLIRIEEGALRSAGMVVVLNVGLACGHLSWKLSRIDRQIGGV